MIDMSDFQVEVRRAHRRAVSALMEVLAEKCRSLPVSDMLPDGPRCLLCPLYEDGACTRRNKNENSSSFTAA